MTRTSLHGFLACALLVVTIARADEVTVVKDVLGPEGPLYVDGSLFYVGWVSSTLEKWDDGKATVLDSTPHCGHNGIALTKQKTLLLACSERGAIIELDLKGKQLRSWDKDSEDRPFEGGVNDVVVTADGGAYATLFGAFVGEPGAVIGKILYLAPGGKKWVAVADDLNYANGIAVSPDQQTLYVNETVGNCILKFSIEKDGTLSQRANFALLNVLVPNKRNTAWIGPDSLKVDSKGDLYVAQWSGGKILKLSPEGKLLHVFEIEAGDGTTNVAFGRGEKELFVTVVKDPDDPQARGSVVKIPNER